MMANYDHIQIFDESGALLVESEPYETWKGSDTFEIDGIAIEVTTPLTI